MTGGAKRARVAASGAALPTAAADAAEPGSAAPPPSSTQPSGGGGGGDGLVALHRSRLFDWKPSAVVAISACPGTPLFAVGYENGSLELWDVHQLVCTQAVVGPSLELTSVAWARDTVDGSWRTFAAYLDGTVAEVLWRQAAVAHALDTCGGVVWGLAAQPLADVKPGFAHQLAAACDDGSVRLLGCEGGEAGLVLERVLARLEGRLLCCAWHSGSASLAVSGTAGNIHLLDATTGHELLRITARASTVRPLTVWRLLSLPDGTLVSGDSDGATQMWDGRFGTLLQRFVQHRADVLALAAAEGGSCVFAAGVDSQVAMFQRVEGGAGGSGTSSSSGRPDAWVYTHYKRPHTHDVRALAAVALGGDKGSILVSGGVDAQLLAYRSRAFLQEHPLRLTNCPQRPICQAASAMSSRALLLVAQHDTVDVWQVAECSPPPAPAAGPGPASASAGVRQQQQQQQQQSSSGSRGPQAQHQQATPPSAHGAGHEGQALDMLAGPRHLARIQLKGARVVSAAIDPAGRYIAVTTPSGSRAYSVTLAGAGAAAVERLKLAAPAAEEGAVAVAVAGDVLVLAQRSGALASYSLADGRQLGSHNLQSQLQRGASSAPLDQAWRGHCPAAARLAVSADGCVLAALGGHGISVHRLPSLELVQARLLKAEHAITAMALSADGGLVAATTSASQLLVWDAAACKPLAWSLENADAAKAAIERLPGLPSGVSFAPPAGDADARAGSSASGPRLVVYGSGGLVHFELGRPVDRTYLDAAAAKRQRGRVRPEARAQPEDLQQRPGEGPAGGRGKNGRVVRAQQQCLWLWLGHVGPGDIMLLEKQWEEVLAALPPPLLRHRYGG